MGSLILVLGGQKSGKSSLAARRAAASGRPVVVVAPAVARDDEFAARVARHRADRPEHWRTVETFDLTGAVAAAGPGAFVLVDALDTWLAESMESAGVQVGDDVPDQQRRAELERVLLDRLREFATAVASSDCAVLMIAGQPGLGVHAGGPGARAYVDLHGLAVQVVSEAADEVLLVVGGRVLPLIRDEPIATTPIRPHAHVDRPVADPRAVEELVGSIVPVDESAAKAAREQHDGLAKPPGSLGRLEELGVQLAAISGTCPPPVPASPVVIVAAGDHGVHAQGVSDWPQSVTAAMVATVAAGRASVNAIARAVGASVTVLDVGTQGGASVGGVRAVRIAAGTRDVTKEPAMTEDECRAAIAAGVEAARDLIEDGADLIATGDLGIANTTVSACLVAALTGAAPTDVAGRGANLDDTKTPRKIQVIEAALARHGADRSPLATLASLGGFEHAALVGVMLAAAQARVPVVLDGVIANAAALAAMALCPAVSGYMIAGHLSAEPGARHALAALGQAGLLDLHMRLGEGTGSVLAVPVIQAAARVLGEVATLNEVAHRLLLSPGER
ncbi:MAG TPA: nicotinate-nucleotide--dimethylbenzimidazole phosphoribosyltransferase [Jiangellaceae bacterium]